MGSVYKYQTQKGRRWEARYRKPDGKPARKAGFLVRADAQAFLDAIEVDKRQGSYIAPSAGRVTIDDLGRKWLVAHKIAVKASTYRTDESAWRIHVQPQWGARTVASIEHDEIQDWVAELAAEKSATTVSRCFGVLANILDAAVRSKRVGTNAARGVKLPRRSKTRRPYLTHAQVESLATQARGRADFIRFLAYTGLRWGEATGLRVRDVNLATRRVNVEENAVEVGYEIVVGAPKSHERRTVAYPAFLDDGVAAACKGKPADALVWSDDGKKYLRAGNRQSGWFVGAVRRAQAGDDTFPYLSPHGLRHTAASLAISAGANPKVVQTMLGHASAAMTLDTYADLFPDDLDVVIVALDRQRTEQLSGNAAVTDLRRNDVS
ncbi:MAG: site-specific integrase [Propionibacteriaceae bacterium]|nr:site-specific integrase [Propionibacteriaceae bacterium]